MRQAHLEGGVERGGLGLVAGVLQGAEHAQRVAQRLHHLLQVAVRHGRFGGNPPAAGRRRAGGGRAGGACARWRVRAAAARLTDPQRAAARGSAARLCSRARCPASLCADKCQSENGAFQVLPATGTPARRTWRRGAAAHWPLCAQFSRCRPPPLCPARARRCAGLRAAGPAPASCCGAPGARAAAGPRAAAPSRVHSCAAAPRPAAAAMFWKFGFSQPSNIDAILAKPVSARPRPRLVMRLCFYFGWFSG